MTLGSDPIKTEYQYIWTPFGLIKKPSEQESIKIPFVQQEIKTGDASGFTFLQTPSSTAENKPNTVFPTKTVPSNTYTIAPETKMAEADVKAQAKMAEAENKAQAKMTEAEDKFNKASKVAEEKFEKTGESVDERLSRYYSKYKNATPNEKEQLLDKYITQSYSAIKGKSKEEQIQIQLTDYKKLLYNTKEGDSYEMLAKRINILEKENQVSAAKSATLEQANLDLRKRGEIGVAKTIQNCDKGNQIELTQLVVDSKNAEAINIGASHASELYKTNQVSAVDIYKTADISKEAKIDLGKTIIDQYAKFDVANQVEIHKSMSDKDYWDKKTIVYAASNIYRMDKTNQAQGVQITVNTKNEEAANAAAANYSKYDASARAEIKSIINNSDCDSAKETMAKAEEQARTEEEQKEASKEESSETRDNKENSSTAKINAVKEMIQNKNMDAPKLKLYIENLTSAEKIALLKQCRDNEVIINAILNSNPSMEVLSEIGNVSSGKILSNSKMLESQLSFLGSNAQRQYIKNCDTSDLRLITRSKLNADVRAEYDKTINKRNKNDIWEKVG